MGDRRCRACSPRREFFADKIPGVDSGWDLLHTLLRVPAGAFLAAATLSPDGELGAGVLATGAGVALASHVLKAGSRACSTPRRNRSATGPPRSPRTSRWSAALALVFAYPWIALGWWYSISVLIALLVWWVWRALSRLGRKPASNL